MGAPRLSTPGSSSARRMLSAILFRIWSTSASDALRPETLASSGTDLAQMQRRMLPDELGDQQVGLA